MKLFITFVVAITFSLGINQVSFAQQPNKKTQQIEAIKFGYISGKLELNDEESKEFWPLYKDYQAEWNQLIKQKKQSRIANANDPNKAVDDDFSFDSRLLELKKKYRMEFGKVLPPEKIKKLYQAERSFREELIKQLKNRP
ncbi:hypothetical protein [Pedobacter arcticus]|uniref:hypothetical protein n=1 Tax=Pedobacter arcticus TaxID=752140 RepID=UPI0002DFBF40|nr:hypothetical protein [Pedobacter arcticus]